MIKTHTFVENPDEISKNVPSHRIFCLDCSGSMCSSMEDMRKQMKNKLPALIRDVDFISIIWFSGRGEFGTIFEHISIKDLSDLNTIHNAIDRYLTTIGSTGFVEPIRKAKDLAEKYPEQPQVFFLSDGGENCWPLDETREAFAAMKGIPMVIVEYQYYCDRKFLQELAALSDAVSVFNEDFEMYDNTFSAYMQNQLSKNRSIDVEPENDIVYFDSETFTIKNGSAGKVYLPIHIQQAWEIHRGHDDNEYNEDEKYVTNDEKYIKLLYGIQTRNHLLITSTLSTLGDVYLTCRFSVCFSKQDYSRLFEYVKNCYFNPTEYAFKDGIDYTFKPSDDTFNVIEFLELIERDKKARFYPYHPSFTYERISKEVKDEAVRFVPNKDLGSSYNLVFNQSRANISLGCQVYGYNETTENDEVSVSPVTAYRNYAILKDGIKNVNTLPMKISQNTYDKLVQEKCITGQYNKNTIYEVSISNLPVVNRKFVSKSITSTDFCTKHIQLHISKGNVKYLKKMLDNLEEKEEKEEEKEEKPVYKKKVDPNIVRDFYNAPELNVKISKCSTIPTVNDKLTTKMNTSPSKLTLSEELLYTIHTEYEAVESEKQEWLKVRLDVEKEVVRRLTMETEQAKMAILVGSCWFNGTSIDDKTFSVSYEYKNNKTYTFEVTVDIAETKVYMD
jgi:hypothetical protein